MTLLGVIKDRSLWSSRGPGVTLVLLPRRCGGSGLYPTRVGRGNVL